MPAERDFSPAQQAWLSDMMTFTELSGSDGDSEAVAFKGLKVHHFGGAGGGPPMETQQVR